MKVKDLIKILENSNMPDNEVLCYRTENSVLTVMVDIDKKAEEREGRER